MEELLSISRFFRRPRTISEPRDQVTYNRETDIVICPPEGTNKKQKGILKKKNTTSSGSPILTSSKVETLEGHVNAVFNLDIEIPMLTSPTTNTLEGHVKAIFKLGAYEARNNCSVSAFGHKGNNVGEFQDAKDITCLPDNRLLITDLINNRLQIFSDITYNVNIFSPEEIHQPWASAITKDNYIAVTLCKERCVKVLNSDGDVVFSFGRDHFSRPTGIAVDKYGNFIVCDDILKEVLVFDCKGDFICFLRNQEDKQCFNKPRYVWVSLTGDIIVSDAGHHQVTVFDKNCDFVRSFGSFGKGDMQFKCPYGICTNTCGDIFVADHYNSRISMFQQDGTFIRHLVTSEHGLVHPQGLTIGPKSNLYVTHGNLKANEILAFKLKNERGFEDNNVISHI